MVRRTRAGRLRKGGSELRWIRGCERHRRGGWVRCRGGDSCGPTGVSTRCARPPHALRPCRVTRRPSLRSESNYGPCGPGWTGASRPSTASRRMRDEQSTGGLGRARSRGAVEAANAGAFWLRRPRATAIPHPHLFQETRTTRGGVTPRSATGRHWSSNGSSRPALWTVPGLWTPYGRPQVRWIPRCARDPHRPQELMLMYTP